MKVWFSYKVKEETVLNCVLDMSRNTGRDRVKEESVVTVFWICRERLEEVRVFK